MESSVPTLPKDLAPYMAQFMATSDELLRWVIITCLERDSTGKSMLPVPMSQLFKQKVEYEKRSKERNYFRITSCSLHKNMKYCKSQLFMNGFGYYDKHGQYCDPLDKLPDEFKPFEPFFSKSVRIEYTEDGNSHLNGRVYIDLDNSGNMILLGKFKDSKIVGEIIMRDTSNDNIRVLPLDDPSLHNLSICEVFDKLKEPECNIEEEMMLRTASSVRFIFKD